ncbi:hypothetical protein [Endozoicomonas atrinae]|uniref:hypothetical protein n=1 Tax=Endozoicomonas atrinae TaxID=1333660 RepID=UPI000826481B|nr:hypothetical protein [Endozoicomonas atrinae]
MATPGPVTHQATTTHNPPAPPPLPGAKPSSVPKAQSVALTQSTKVVDRSTQFPSVAPRLQLSDRVKQGISALEAHKNVKFADEVEVIPPQEAPAEATPAEKPAEPAAAGKPADDKAAEKSEKKEEPITVVHKRSLGERIIVKLKVVGSYLIAPLKLIVTVVKFAVKPLQDYVITPLYEGFLYIFQPAKYEARKLEQKAAAEKAELDQKRVNRQAFEKACLDVAMKRLIDLDKQVHCKALATHFGVTQREVLDEVMKQEARAEANHLFKTQLETGNLELNALRVNPETGKPELNLLREDQETGKKYYATRTFTPATEKTRAAVLVVTGKDSKGNDVGELLDADSAEVAKKLGNDPAMASALNKYNKELEEYEQKLSAYKEEDAKYKKAKEKGKTPEKEPVHPGEPPKRPVLKCTDDNVLEAIKLESKQYHEELQAKVQALAGDIESLKAAFAEAYPRANTTQYIRMAIEPQEHKANMEALVKTSETRLEEQRQALKQAEEREDKRLAALISAETQRLEKDIDFNQRHLAIYAKECELASVQAELKELNETNLTPEKNRAQDIDDWKNGALVLDPEHPDHEKRVSGTRDRLEIERLKGWVYKDAKGKELDIFTRDANGRVTGVDKDKYAQVNDIVIPTPDKRQNPAPAYKGVNMPGPDYRDQKGMEWGLREEGHWAVRDSNIVGLHKKAAVFGNPTPELHGTPEVVVASTPETPVVSEPEPPVIAPEVLPIEAWMDEAKQALDNIKAARREPHFALTTENVDTFNKQQAAEKRRSEPRAASVTGVPLSAGDDSETGDDESVMDGHLFARAEEINQFNADSERLGPKIDSMKAADQSQRYRERMAMIAERENRGTARSGYDAPRVTSEDNPGEAYLKQLKARREAQLTQFRETRRATMSQVHDMKRQAQIELAGATQQLESMSRQEIRRFIDAQNFRRENGRDPKWGEIANNIPGAKVTVV